jgi:hypothetical protein
MRHPESAGASNRPGSWSAEVGPNSVADAMESRNGRKSAMKPHVRAAVAAAAISHASGRRVLSVYDHSSQCEARVSASATGNKVGGYDSDHLCQFGGAVPALYHHGEAAHLDLIPRGEGGYGGYDHGSATHFEVRVTGRDAQIYDHRSREWFAYSARAPASAVTGY